MLRQVLRELETAQGPMNLNDLGRKLGVERGALEGMIAFWVRKGRLQDDDQALATVMGNCTSGDCGSGAACPGPQGCPFVVKMPRTYTLTLRGDE